MKKLFICFYIFALPLLTFANSSNWKDGVKSKARIISSENYIAIEISLKDNYLVKVESPSYKNIKINIDGNSNLKDYSLFFPKPNYFKNNQSYLQKNIIIPIKIIPKEIDNPVDININIAYPVCNKDCIMENLNFHYSFNIEHKDPISLAAISKTLSEKDTNTGMEIIYIAFMALMGGLILNLMPCVLPVLGLKLNLINKTFSKSPKNLIYNLIASSIGIIFSFQLIAVFVIFLKNIGEDFGYSFYFQNPYFIIFITLILMIAGSSMLDRININLPNLIHNKIASLEGKLQIGVISSFMTGCFTTLMATPCTAPFVSTAIGFALAGSSIEIIFVFFMMGIGLSLPYLMIALIPKSINFLPRSGRWFELFKKIMAILIYLSVIWFTYVVSNQLSNIAALVFFLLLILFKFFLEVNTNSLFKTISIMLVIIGSFTLPNYANIEHIAKEQMINQIWHKFEFEQIKKQTDLGKVVIVDVTASWCGTCQFNKLLVLDSDYIIDKLNQTNIYAMRADVTSSFTPDIKDFLRRYNHFAVPFNIVFGPQAPNGIILSPLLSISEVNQALEDAR
jgi:suppressor for copper-sensitivity B